VVKVRHAYFGKEPVVGSLQRYVPHKCPAADMGAGAFSVLDVHRIGALDVRLFNTDRHDENLLVADGSSGSGSSRPTLVPIDHGFALPATPVDGAMFCWQHWPQAREPFAPATLAAIAALDPAADAALLKALGLPTDLLVACTQYVSPIFSLVLSSLNRI
jgi:hypothetical protein